MTISNRLLLTVFQIQYIIGASIIFLPKVYMLAIFLLSLKMVLMLQSFVIIVSYLRSKGNRERVYPTPGSLPKSP